MLTETETHDETAPSVLESAWRFRTVVLVCVGVFALLGLLYGAVTSGDASATALKCRARTPGVIAPLK